LKKLLVSFKNVALVKEVESPENPGGLEERVALTPGDVGRLVNAGINVFVEQGAGLGVDFTDEEYTRFGAEIQGANEIYQNKDMIIKFKGPSLESIGRMKKACTLFCMAHFHSFPERAKLLAESEINVIAMEQILESPKFESDEKILARTAMATALKPFIESDSMKNLHVFVVGQSVRLVTAMRRAANRGPASLNLLNENIQFSDLSKIDVDALYFYDSSHFIDSSNVIEQIKQKGVNVYDLHQFEKEQGVKAIATYKKSHPPYEFGLRRIQCLHETGQAGARYGVKLLKKNKPHLKICDAKVIVLGYGNVAQGAIHELYDQGVNVINILGRAHTVSNKIEHWLKDADLIVNGADLPEEKRGVIFLITNEHLKTVVPDDSVVIDLVGGSAVNRSAVEAVIDCTFLTDPYFIKEGVTVSALWGWPMMGMVQESVLKYSSQITDVLVKDEKLIEGLDCLAIGVARALVCGPFTA